MRLENCGPGMEWIPESAQHSNRYMPVAQQKVKEKEKMKNKEKSQNNLKTQAIES